MSNHLISFLEIVSVLIMLLRCLTNRSRTIALHFFIHCRVLSVTRVIVMADSIALPRTTETPPGTGGGLQQEQSSIGGGRESSTTTVDPSPGDQSHTSGGVASSTTAPGTQPPIVGAP